MALGPAYYQPIITPDDFPNTAEGLEAYQRALDLIAVGPHINRAPEYNAHGNYMPHNAQELTAINFGGYGDGMGPIGANGAPTDITRSSNSHKLANGSAMIYSRAKVRPEEAIAAYFLVNPDGTPVLDDQSLRMIEVALNETLGPDWFEQAYEDARQNALGSHYINPEDQAIYDAGMPQSQIDRQNSMRDANRAAQEGMTEEQFLNPSLRTGAPHALYPPGTTVHTVVDANGDLVSRSGQIGQPREIPIEPPPAGPVRQVPMDANGNYMPGYVPQDIPIQPPAPPAPVPAAPVYTAPYVPPYEPAYEAPYAPPYVPPAPAAPAGPQVTGPGASGAAPPQQSAESEWAFDNATGMYCNTRTGECI